MRTMCSREIFTKKCRQQQIFDSDLKGAWRYNHVTFTPIAKNFMSYCILIYMLSILCVRLTMKVKVGIPESFRGAWYPPKKLGRVTLIFLLYCASNDICFCNIVCMWLYWALWDMESYFWVHLLYFKGRRTWRRGPRNSLYSSPGDSSMHVRAFIMLLLWSKKEYGLLKANLWRLGLRGFFK